MRLYDCFVMISRALSRRALEMKLAVVALALGLLAPPAAAIDTGGEVDFDTFFAGGTVDAQITSMNTWAQGFSASDPRPTVVFRAKEYAFSTAIKLWSGLSLRGASGRSVREYTTGTSFKWNGAAGTSMLTFTGSQTGQGYPSDGSPRNITMENILFRGTSTTHFLPKYDPTTYGTNGPGHVLWMSTFHNVGWKTFATIAWGWFDGVTISGPVHFQEVYDTAFYLGGSENSLFTDEYSFGDTAASTNSPVFTTGLPFIRSVLSKSRIGGIMLTGRKKGYGLSIEGGQGLLITGAAFDAQDSDPMYGSAVRISGGDGIRIIGCSFKGAMSNPGSANGGTTANRGWITVTGGRQIVIDGTNFHRGGSSPAPTSTPLVWVSSAVDVDEVKWGSATSASGYAGTAAVIAHAVAGRIVNNDPSVALVVAP